MAEDAYLGEEMIMDMDMTTHTKPLVCCTCHRELDPHEDAIVFLGWGERYDGKPGPGWVAALCAPAPHQMSSGSPCVRAARDWAEENDIVFSPSDYEGWVGHDAE